MKSDVYKINNAVEKIKTGKNTQFLDGRELKIVTGKLKKNEYNVYYPYKDSEKVMLYTGKVPKVKLFKIYTGECKIKCVSNKKTYALFKCDKIKRKR